MSKAVGKKELALGTDIGNACQLMSSPLDGRFRVWGDREIRFLPPAPHATAARRPHTRTQPAQQTLLQEEPVRAQCGTGSTPTGIVGQYHRPWECRKYTLYS
ncbi:unnamed protein product [Pleuronectes platessa]|uniref:Uncharacterized protein n=1 Tax=Pleuronectes platessa TaxID=8262 RepID=A0A9N7Z2Q6_PLEPL|nr:unnamed protein product [Pleuronectes platessa]